MNKKYLIFTVLSALIASLGIFSCNKVDYPNGLPEYDNYYYIGFLPWDNKPVVVVRSQSELLALPVQFHTAFTRNYDAIAHYKLDTTGIADPAQPGVDFNIVDKNGKQLQPEGDSVYTITFVQAKQANDTIYVQLLNNPVQGTRTININLSVNQTPQYTVGIFSQAFSRPIQIE